jgi:hypothetical protein
VGALPEGGASDHEDAIGFIAIAATLPNLDAVLDKSVAGAGDGVHVSGDGREGGARHGSALQGWSRLLMLTRRTIHSSRRMPVEPFLLKRARSLSKPVPSSLVAPTLLACAPQKPSARLPDVLQLQTPFPLSCKRY